MLLKAIRNLSAQGIAVIFITHRLQEILAREVPALYIQDPIQIYVTTSRLEGFSVFPINIFKFNEMNFV